VKRVVEIEEEKADVKGSVVLTLPEIAVRRRLKISKAYITTPFSGTLLLQPFAG
jgi:hypothetical protein